MPGVNTLSPGVQCNGICLISRQETSRGGVNVIQMYDNQCYYTKYIYLYIINLIKKGLTLGNPNFVLPTKAPITKADLDLLYLDPSTFPAMHAEWLESPAYALEHAQTQSDALAAAMAAVEADTAHVPVIADGNGMHEVNTVLRWGVQVDREEEVEYRIEYINRVDRFLLPVDYDNNFDHNDDENIGRRRIRNIGVREIDLIGNGQRVPAGVPLVIRFNGDFYNTLEELAVAMGKTVAEISGNVTGGKRKTKRRRSRKSRRTKHRRR
jgi:hypothetical protein